MRSSSLIRRTIAVVLLAQFLCAIAFSLTALEHERHTRTAAFDIMLQGRSDSVLGAIQDAEDEADNVTIDPAELRLPRNDFYAVYNLDGSLLSGSARPPAMLAGRRLPGFYEAFAEGRHYRILERRALRLVDRERSGAPPVRRPVTILYASPTDHIRHEIREAAGFYASVSALCLMLTAALLVFLLRRVLHPIRELAEEARAVSVQTPRFQAPPSALRVRELQPLAETLSAAIDGLRQALEHEHRFVGDAAHELKTAIAVVRSTIQLMMMRIRSPQEYAHGLETLLADSGRVEDLVARMLLLARMEEKTQEEEEVIDLAAAAQSTMAKLRGLAEFHGVALHARLAHGAAVRLSAEKADVLLSNLALNAVQHSPRGSQVEVVLRAAGGGVTIQVRDQGQGISAGALPHVFQRFYREDTSRSRATGGSGLGLAICKSIVESAAGRISIQSTVGVGTTVSIDLPAACGATPKGSGGEGEAARADQIGSAG